MLIAGSGIIWQKSEALRAQTPAQEPAGKPAAVLFTGILAGQPSHHATSHTPYLILTVRRASILKALKDA